MNDMKEALAWALHRLDCLATVYSRKDDEFLHDFRRAKAILEGRDPDGEDGR